MPAISIIVAADQNKAIGKDNRLPWHLPNDLKFFKNKTMGRHMIMGRKTIESIGKALPGRVSVVVTRQKDYKFEGAVIARSVKEALEFVNKHETDEAFVIGGAEIINQTIDYADTIYFTDVKTKIDDADVFLENFHPDNWEEVDRVSHEADDKHAFSYDFVIYKRKKS